MAKLNIESFEEKYRETVFMECALYLYECLDKDTQKQLKDDWNNAGGYKVIPWYKWCMEHINVNYTK